MSTKTCLQCRVSKQLVDFHKNGNYRKNKCKKCINSNRSSYTHGINALSADDRIEIKSKLLSGEKKKLLSEEYNLSYVSLCYWIRNNKL